MLAVVRYLEVQRHFLKGAVVKFEIQTDYKNLEYFMRAQKLNQRQERQVSYLSGFDFTLKHVLGSKIEKADSLSRRPDQELGIEKDNKNKMLVKPEQLEVREIEVVKIIVNGIDLLEKVKRSKVKDDKVVKAVEEIKQAEVKVLINEE